MRAPGCRQPPFRGCVPLRECPALHPRSPWQARRKAPPRWPSDSRRPRYRCATFCDRHRTSGVDAEALERVREHLSGPGGVGRPIPVRDVPEEPPGRPGGWQSARRGMVEADRVVETEPDERGIRMMIEIHSGGLSGEEVAG